MYRISFLSIVFLLCFLPLAQAQFSGGFVAGLNFATINGPSEMDANGQSLDNYSYRTSFHLGGRFNYMFNEILGVRAEILYSQKGGQYTQHQSENRRDTPFACDGENGCRFRCGAGQDGRRPRHRELACTAARFIAARE